MRLKYLHFVLDLTNKCHVSTDRFLSPLQGLLSHDDVVFEDAVAPVCCKISLLRENIRIARHTSLPEEKLELLPMDMFPVELPSLKRSGFSESLLLASRSAAATVAIL